MTKPKEEVLQRCLRSDDKKLTAEFSNGDGDPVSDKMAVGFFKRHMFNLHPAMQQLVTSVTIVASRPADLTPEQMLFEKVPAAEARIRMPEITYSVALIEEVTKMVDEATHELAVLAFQALDETERHDLAKFIADRLKKPQSQDAVAAAGKKAIDHVIEVLVERELEAAMPVLMHRIQEFVEAKWEERVQVLAEKKLAAALEKVKSEMSKS